MNEKYNDGNNCRCNIVCIFWRRKALNQSFGFKGIFYYETEIFSISVFKRRDGSPSECDDCEGRGQVFIEGLGSIPLSALQRRPGPGAILLLWILWFIFFSYKYLNFALTFRGSSSSTTQPNLLFSLNRMYNELGWMVSCSEQDFHLCFPITNNIFQSALGTKSQKKKPSKLNDVFSRLHSNQ